MLRAPQEVSCTIHRVDKPGVVPQIDHVVSTDDRSRLDWALRLILPEHLVAVASNAEKRLQWVRSRARSGRRLQVLGPARQEPASLATVLPARSSRREFHPK